MSTFRAILENADFAPGDSDLQLVCEALKPIAEQCDMKWDTNRKQFEWDNDFGTPGHVILEIRRPHQIQVRVSSRRGDKDDEWMILSPKEVPTSEIKASIIRHITKVRHVSALIVSFTETLNSEVAKPLGFSWITKSGDFAKGERPENIWRSKDRRGTFTLKNGIHRGSGDTGMVVTAQSVSPNRTLTWPVPDPSHFDCSKILRFFNKDN